MGFKIQGSFTSAARAIVDLGLKPHLDNLTMNRMQAREGNYLANVNSLHSRTEKSPHPPSPQPMKSKFLEMPRHPLDRCLSSML